MFISSQGFLNATGPEAVTPVNTESSGVRLVDKVPSSATKSVYNIDDDTVQNPNSLTFEPITLSGTFTNSDMSRVGYLIITLPSGVTSTKSIKTEMNESFDKVSVKVQMPSFLTNSFLLHKHIFPDNGMLLLGTEQSKVPAAAIDKTSRQR